MLPLVGAELVSSAIYGATTVLFVLIGERLGLGAAGYGYLLSTLGAGGVLAAGLAGRAVATPWPRRTLIATSAAIGLPLMLLVLARSVPAALMLAAAIGAGQLVSEVVADTAIQRSLDPAVVARAYGLAVPAGVAGIAAGALVAPPCIGADRPQRHTRAHRGGGPGVRRPRVRPPSRPGARAAPECLDDLSRGSERRHRRLTRTVGSWTSRRRSSHR